MGIPGHISLILLALPVCLGGCASSGVHLPGGTRLLSEVSHVLASEEVTWNQLGPRTQVQDLGGMLARHGITPDEVQRGRVIVVQDGVYWHNTLSGIKHPMLSPVLLPENLEVAPGNIVEVAAKGQGDTRPATIVRVRAASLEAGRCRYDELPTGVFKGLMGAISMVGPRGAATLYCEGIEQEGWQRPRTYWHKLPALPAPDAGAMAPRCSQL